MRAGAGPELPPGLIDDVVAMTTAAADDGLPLQSVYDDLRDVLGLEPGADLPAEVLRQCALAWADAHARPAGHPGVPRLGGAELDDLAWQQALALPAGDAGAVVSLAPPADGDALAVDPLLEAAAATLARVFAGPGEVVVLASPSPAGGPAAGAVRVVALVAAAGLPARLDAARDALAALPGDVARWPLLTDEADAHDGGLPAAVRTLLQGDAC